MIIRSHYEGCDNNQSRVVEDDQSLLLNLAREARKPNQEKLVHQEKPFVCLQQSTILLSYWAYMAF